MSKEEEESSTSSKKYKSKKPVYLGTFFTFKKSVDNKFTGLSAEMQEIERKLFWRSLITLIAVLTMFVLMYIYQ